MENTLFFGPLKKRCSIILDYHFCLKIKLKLTQQIALFTTTLLLCGALLFPSVVQFAHIFEGHDHKPCKELTTHLHEKKTECDIHFFHFSQADLALNRLTTIIISEANQQLVDFYTSSDKNKLHNHTTSRGPPTLS